MPGSENLSQIEFHYIYAIQSIKYHNLYIGYSTDLRNRLQEHNSGKVFSTKSSLPWRLIYYEACLSEKDAKGREKYLKTNQGSRILKRRLKEYFYNLNNS